MPAATDFFVQLESPKQIRVNIVARLQPEGMSFRRRKTVARLSKPATQA